MCDGHRSFGNFDASTVFREGAENSTRGGCAPHQLRNSGLVPHSSAKTSRRLADWSDRDGRAPYFLFQLSAFSFQHFPTGHIGAAELVRSGHAPKRNQAGLATGLIVEK
jgi:hypothetical protein